MKARDQDKEENQSKDEAPVSFITIQTRPKDLRISPDRLLMGQTACARRFQLL